MSLPTDPPIALPSQPAIPLGPVSTTLPRGDEVDYQTDSLYTPGPPNLLYQPISHLAPRKLLAVAIVATLLISSIVGAVGGLLITHSTAKVLPTTELNAAPNTQRVDRIVHGATNDMVNINTGLGYQDAVAAGTGIVLSARGLVVTNNHVIAGATTISATDLGNGNTYSATVVGYDRSADLAVLRLSGANGLSYMHLPTSTTLRKGQSIISIGNAGGLGSPAVSSGTVLALDQQITASLALTGSSEHLSGLVATTADIVPGDSGGALLTTSGRLAGINVAASEGLAAPITGFAIPVATVKSVVAQITNATANPNIHLGPTALLGVLTDSQPSVNGVLVYKTIPGSPAGSVLAAGDTITGINNTPITTPTSLTEAILPDHPGDTVSISWTDSSGVVHSAKVTLSSGPAQ
jgi:S1-C subfamily serine protease